MAGEDRYVRALLASVSSDDDEKLVYRRTIWRPGPQGKPRPIFEHWVDNPYEDPNKGQVKVLGTVRELRRTLGMKDTDAQE